MSRIFFFKSSRKSDKLSQLTIMSSSVRRATNLAIISFAKYGYKGSPVII